MFHCSIPAPTLNNATVKDDSTSLSELLLQMKTEINDDFKILFTELKDIRLKLKGLECKITYMLQSALYVNLKFSKQR